MGNAKMSFYEYDVFISYSWNYNKELVNELYRQLMNKEISVWKDDEGGMHGSTIRSMQYGIQRAKCVVIMVSDAYLQSANCQLELDYCFSQKKMKTVVLLQKTTDIRNDILLCNHLYIQDDNAFKPFDKIAFNCLNYINMVVDKDPNGNEINVNSPPPIAEEQMREAIAEFEETDDEGDEFGVLQTELNELEKLEPDALELDDDDIERNQIKFTAGVSLRQPKTWLIPAAIFGSIVVTGMIAIGVAP